VVAIVEFAHARIARLLELRKPVHITLPLDEFSTVWDLTLDFVHESEHLASVPPPFPTSFRSQEAPPAAPTVLPLRQALLTQAREWYAMSSAAYNPTVAPICHSKLIVAGFITGSVFQGHCTTYHVENYVE
jgi:hypothetical protein